MFSNLFIFWCSTIIWGWWRLAQSELRDWGGISFKHQVFSNFWFNLWFHSLTTYNVIKYLSIFSKFFVSTSNKDLFIMSVVKLGLYNWQVTGDPQFFPLVTEFWNLYLHVKFDSNELTQIKMWFEWKLLLLKLLSVCQ